MSEIEQFQYEQAIARLEETNARYDKLRKAVVEVDMLASHSLNLLDMASERMNQLYAHLGEGADDTRLSVEGAVRDMRQNLESRRSATTARSVQFPLVMLFASFGQIKPGTARRRAPAPDRLRSRRLARHGRSGGTRAGHGMSGRYGMTNRRRSPSISLTRLFVRAGGFRVLRRWPRSAGGAAVLR